MTTDRAAARRAWLLPSLAGYRRQWLSRDLIAGLSAGAVVIPQGMAYATIADLPVEVGLYTCIVPMMVYAFLGGSRAMSVSTTSTIATLTATGLVAAGVVAGAEDALGALVTLTLLVGTTLLVLRSLRLGSLVATISSATVLGVQIGVAATVAVGQLPTLFGVEIDDTGHGFVRSLLRVIEVIPQMNVATVVLSAASVVVLLVLKRLAPKVPAALFVAVAGILLVAFTGLSDAGVHLIDPVPQGLPVLRMPDLTHVAGLIPAALGIAVMAFLESVAVARTLRNPNDVRIDNDQELLAVSAANIAGAFFATLPAAGGFSQSAVNRDSGARTQLAALTTVALAILVALFFGPALSLLPQATLAALVFVAVLGLIKVHDLARLARISPIDFWVALVTAVIGLTAGLLPAVGAGVVITLILVLRELNIPRLDVIARRGDVLAIRLAVGLYSANSLRYTAAILDFVSRESTPVTALVLDVRRLDAVTITVLDALAELDRDLAADGVKLHLACLPASGAAVADKLPWYRSLRQAERAHETVEAALAAGGAPRTADGREGDSR